MKIIAALGLIYLVIRFLFVSRLDAISPYASYEFEFALVGVAVFLTRHEIKSYFKLDWRLDWLSLAALPCGFIIYKIAAPIGVAVPFQFDSKETVLFLLLIGPILEEFLFRYFLWRPISTFLNPISAYIGMAALFAFSHFHSYWFVDPEIHPFIFYQTVYTFGLALACGYPMLRRRSLVGAILIHFFFNLGFYFGYVI